MTTSPHESDPMAAYAASLPPVLPADGTGAYAGSAGKPPLSPDQVAAANPDPKFDINDWVSVPDAEQPFDARFGLTGPRTDKAEFGHSGRKLPRAEWKTPKEPVHLDAKTFGRTHQQIGTRYPETLVAVSDSLGKFESSLPFDTAFDRLDYADRMEEAVKTGEAWGDIPEIKPAFLGLRSYVANRRIEKERAKLEAAAKLHNVVRYMGEKIIAGTNYSSERTNPNRPTTRAELKIGKQLQKNRRRRMPIVSALGVRERNRPDLIHDTPSDPRKRPQKPEHHLSKRESKNEKFEDVAHKRLSKHLHHVDHKLKHILDAPKQEADRARKEITKNVTKLAAIERAVELKDARKLQKKSSAQLKSMQQQVQQNETDQQAKQAERDAAQKALRAKWDAATAAGERTDIEGVFDEMAAQDAAFAAKDFAGKETKERADLLAKKTEFLTGEPDAWRYSDSTKPTNRVHRSGTVRLDSTGNVITDNAGHPVEDWTP